MQRTDASNGSFTAVASTAAPVPFLTFSNPRALNSVHLALGGIILLFGALFAILATAFWILALLGARCTVCARKDKPSYSLCSPRTFDFLSVRSTEYKSAASDANPGVGPDPILFSKDPVIINAQEESQPLVEPRYLTTRLDRARFIRNVTAMTIIMLMIPTAIALSCASIAAVQNWMARKIHWLFGLCLALVMLTSIVVVLTFRVRVLNVVSLFSFVRKTAIPSPSSLLT